MYDYGLGMNYHRRDCIVIKYENYPSRAEIKKEYGFVPFFFHFIKFHYLIYKLSLKIWKFITLQVVYTN